MNSVRAFALVSICLLATASGPEAQSSDQVRLTLLEASARVEARSCTLEAAVGPTAGEAILTCDRTTFPVSHLAAHRALSASEVARLRALASAAVSAPPRTSSPAPASVDRARTTITIVRGSDRVVVEVADPSNPGSEDERQLLHLLREIASELRGTGRR